MSQRFEKLKNLLKELFQLDQPDLDFGLYRIMHAKSAEVTQFLDGPVAPGKAAFGQYKPADKAELEKELAKAIEQAQGFGADPETLPRSKNFAPSWPMTPWTWMRWRARSTTICSVSSAATTPRAIFSPSESTSPASTPSPRGRGGQASLGQTDQYYIKTSEYLRDYAFRLRPDSEKTYARAFPAGGCRRGRTRNVKAAEGKQRVFILAGQDFIRIESSLTLAG